MITRRRFGAMTGGALASLAFVGGCGRGSDPAEMAAEPNDGRLSARPRENVVTSVEGEHALELDRSRDAILKLPTKATLTPLPLVVMFHGATQSAKWMLGRVGSAADEAGVAVLAPNSRNSSWDAIRGKFGADVTFLNRALESVFDTVSVDPRRIAVGGFSDGATYALSLGLINGDLFSRVIAFSPGFVVEGAPNGKPQFFISHGTADPILPIDRCGRRIVGDLSKRGYQVTFREFDGVHEVPADVAREGLRWVAGMQSS